MAGHTGRGAWAGFLSVFKGFPSIFITSLAVVAVLVWARSRGKLSGLPIFKDLSHNPWPMVLAHVGAFALFFWLTIFVAEGDALSSGLAVYWGLAWAATGLGAGVFWMRNSLVPNYEVKRGATGSRDCRRHIGFQRDVVSLLP